MNNNWSYCLQEFFNSGNWEKNHIIRICKNEKLEDVTLEDVSSKTTIEENLMNSVKKQQVPKEDKISHLYLINSFPIGLMQEFFNSGNWEKNHIIRISKPLLKNLKMLTRRIYTTILMNSKETAGTKRRLGQLFMSSN